MPVPCEEVSAGRWGLWGHDGNSSAVEDMLDVARTVVHGQCDGGKSKLFRARVQKTI